VNRRLVVDKVPAGCDLRQSGKPIASGRTWSGTSSAPRAAL